MSNTTGKQEPHTRGRPRKSEPPRIDYDELDRLLVHGEVVPREDGTSTMVYPSYRDLALRFCVSHSLVAQYARRHNCMRRRAEAQARILVNADNKLVERRATALALTKDDELRIIDGFLLGFDQALAEGRVRFDNPADFNTMVRLKSFIEGGADSRTELHATLTLDDIQARHLRMLRTTAVSTAERDETRNGAGDMPMRLQRVDE